MADGTNPMEQMMASMGVEMAELTGFDPMGRCLVRMAGGDAVIGADSLVSSDQLAVGAMVAVIFQDNDPVRPVVVGLVQRPAGAPEAPVAPTPQAAPASGTGAEPRVHVEAGETLVLSCGKSSIRLSADGRITLRGEHIVSQATGSNRMRGGIVLLN